MNLGLPSGGLRLRTFLSSGRSEVAREAALPASIVLSPPWATGSRRATAGCRTASQSPIIGREEPTPNLRFSMTQRVAAKAAPTKRRFL